MASPQPISSDNLTYIFQIRRDRITPGVEFALELLRKHNTIFEVSSTASARQEGALTLSEPPADIQANRDVGSSGPKRIRIDEEIRGSTVVRGEVENIHNMPFTLYSQSICRVVYACNKCLLENKNPDVWRLCSLAVVRKNKTEIFKRCNHFYDELDFEDDESYGC